MTRGTALGSCKNGHPLVRLGWRKPPTLTFQRIELLFCPQCNSYYKTETRPVPIEVKT